MPSSIQTYIHKLDAMLARPDLQAPHQRERMHLCLFSHWSGILSRIRRGDPVAVGFTASEISDLLVIIQNRIAADRADNKRDPQ